MEMESGHALVVAASHTPTTQMSDGFLLDATAFVVLLTRDAIHLRPTLGRIHIRRTAEDADAIGDLTLLLPNSFGALRSCIPRNRPDPAFANRRRKSTPTGTYRHDNIVASGTVIDDGTS